MCEFKRVQNKFAAVGPGLSTELEKGDALDRLLLFPFDRVKYYRVLHSKYCRVLRNDLRGLQA